MSKKVCYICGKENKFSLRKSKRVSLQEIDGRYFCSQECCGGLDLTDVTTINLEEEVDNLRCNKCATILAKQFVVVVSENDAPNKREEEFVNYIESSDFTWKGQNIEEEKSNG